jgi:cell division protein FtsB
MRAALVARKAQARAYVAEKWRRLLFTAGLVALFFGNQGFRSLVHNYLELRSIKRDIAALERDEKNYAERLRLGDSSIERLARRELGYVRKGEIEYRFPPPPPEK